MLLDSLIEHFFGFLFLFLCFTVLCHWEFLLWDIWAAFCRKI